MGRENRERIERLIYGESGFDVVSQGPMEVHVTPDGTFVDATLMVLGERTTNGRIYRRETVEGALEEFRDSGRPLLASLGDGKRFQDVCADVSDLAICDNEVTGRLRIASTKAGDFVRLLIKDSHLRGASISLGGHGRVTEDGVVEDYEIAGVDVILDGRG